MSSSVGYTSLRAQLRVRLNHRETLLGWFRILRYLLVQGPWRPWLARWYAARNANPPLPAHASTLFDTLDPGPEARALATDGFTSRFPVPPALVTDIAEWTRAVGAQRIDDPHVDCAAVERIAHDPRTIAVARRFLGAEPILFTSKIYWTRPRPGAEGAAENGAFHYDLADLKAVTLFVYLSDVDQESGPHVVVRGTMRRVTPPEILRRTVSDAFVERRFPGRCVTITGPRGTAWFEDITAYHKQAKGSKVRLMLSLIYSLHRRPLEDLEQRPASGQDSRPADRLRARPAGAAAS